MNVSPSPDETEESSDFEFKESFSTPWAPLQTTEVDLEEILKAHDISCSSVKSFEFSFESDAWDTARSLLPLTSHKTLVIKGRR